MKSNLLAGQGALRHARYGIVFCMRAIQRARSTSIWSCTSKAGWHAGKWGGATNLGMGLATFDIMAQLLSHHLIDVAHVWTTRYKTNSPNPYTPSNTDALTARPLCCAVLLALFWSCAGPSSQRHRQIDADTAQLPTLPWGGCLKAPIRDAYHHSTPASALRRQLQHVHPSVACAKRVHFCVTLCIAAAPG